jgi:hypothetical protein
MTIDILRVVDNESDPRLLREILLETNPSVRLRLVSDGLEAMAFLRYPGAPSRCASPGPYPVRVAHA